MISICEGTMGAEFSHTCFCCGYSVKTSGPWEFYRDEGGDRYFCGHPCFIFAEAAQLEIHGLSGEVYCPTCDKVFDLVLVEFKEPARDAISVWSGQCEPQEKYKKKGSVRCPQCGNSHLILGPERETKTRCPRCQKGVLEGRMDWIS